MRAKGGTWTLDELDKFLTSPKEFIPGTAMTAFRNDSDRSDLIAYLRNNSDTP